jgi:hypothetical protein
VPHDPHIHLPAAGRGHDRLGLALELHAAIDELYGVEAVHVYRYGARIDLAPHVVDPMDLAALIHAALELAVVPVWGPIEFEVEGLEGCGDPDCPGCAGDE